MIKALFVLSLIVAPAPALADVIIPGPPLPELKISSSDRQAMDRLARKSVASIFDFGGVTRTEMLDEAYRDATAVSIQGIKKVLAVNVIGYRAFVLAVADTWLSPQMVGETHVYFQVMFDDEMRVAKIEVI